MARNIPFWLVWCEDGGEPRQKHSSQILAEHEAERLAKKNPGKSFCVMAAISRFTERRVTVEHFALTDLDVPF